MFLHDGTRQDQGGELCRKAPNLTTPASLGILGAARAIERRAVSVLARMRRVYRPASADAIVRAESVGAHS